MFKLSGRIINGISRDSAKPFNLGKMERLGETRDKEKTSKQKNSHASIIEIYEGKLNKKRLEDEYQEDLR